MAQDPVKIRRYSTAEEFLRMLGPWLLENETETNVVFSVAELLATGDHPFRPPFYYAALEAAGIAVAATPAEIGTTLQRAMESQSMV